MSKIEIKWEDEDQSFGEEPEVASKEAQDFVDLLGAGSLRSSQPRVGDKVQATIASISETSDDVLVELGGKASAIISKRELMSEDNAILHKVGDTIDAFVVSSTRDEILLSNSMSQAVARDQALEAAYENQIPVKGRVLKVNKGGYEVKLMGSKIAFCPMSQMDLQFVNDPEIFVGRELDFQIEEMSGRKIVISRTALLQVKAEEMLATLRKHVEAGTLVKGTVIQIRDFGAVVDLGGVSGMIHVSELSYGHVGSVGDFIHQGDTVTVKILKIDDGPRENQPRIALSLRAAQTDPWSEIDDLVKVGESYSGQVVKLLDFGAFVSIKPGIDGLIHVSQMSWTKKVHHPKDILKVGDHVSVRVVDIDRGRKRIALSMKSIDEDPWQGADQKFRKGQVLRGAVEELKAQGAIVVLQDGVSGFVPVSALRTAYGAAYRKRAAPPAELDVKVVQIDTRERRILLTLVELNADDESAADYKEFLQSEKAKHVQAAASDMGSFGELLQKSLKK